MLVTSLLSLFLATATLAAPSPRGYPHCPLPKAVSLPGTFTAPAPSPRYIVLGLGVQNYNYSTNAGPILVSAAADLFDISCLFDKPGFAEIEQAAYDLWSANYPSDANALGDFCNKKGMMPLGHHYFVNYNGTLHPKFDFTTALNNPDAFVIAAKAGDVPAPNSKDIDWLDLKALAGQLASEVFRVNTIGGQLPPSSQPSSTLISVPYAAQYWFY
ncbi:hypothetical protein BC826DRAFT_1105460 [Russula brevipes]|nr:hypothetical protein BC826DRAFT_1105460 [Russula brevipes]